MSSFVRRYSTEEYELLEEASEIRNEYFDGKILPRAETDATHSLISVNVCAELGRRLRGRYRVYGSDLKILCPTGLRAYPDVSVSGCSEFEDASQRTLLNPQLIVEVLSKATAGYDRGEKFVNYGTIPSLSEVVFVDQDQVHVEVHTRQSNGQWNVTTYDNLEATVEFPAFECAIPMREIYYSIDWTTSSEE